MSLSSDNVAVTMPVQPAYQGGGYGGGFGGDWIALIVLFFLFSMFGYGGFGGMFGGGWGNGFGGGFGGANGPGFQGYATRSDINDGFALNGLQNGQTSIKDAVTNGFHGVDTAMCNLGTQLQQCLKSFFTKRAVGTCAA